MRLRKYDGEADGWLTAVAKRNAICWDDNNAPCSVMEGERYYVNGDVDSGLFEVDGSFAEDYLKVESGIEEEVE